MRMGLGIASDDGAVPDVGALAQADVVNDDGVGCDPCVGVHLGAGHLAARMAMGSERLDAVEELARHDEALEVVGALVPETARWNEVFSDRGTRPLAAFHRSVAG